MARDVIAHLAERRAEVLPQQAVPVAQHQVLEWIEHGVGDRLHVRIVGEHER